MTTYAVKTEATMVEISCSKCGITFWVPEWWQKEKRENGTAFSCPNGDGRVYKEPEVEKLKKRLVAQELATKEQRERADREERRRIAMAGQVTKVRNRVSNGVCPCCNRTFVNLQRHIGTKHPDWKSQEIGP